MSMRIKRSSVEDVKNRFEVVKKQKEEATKEYNFEERVRQLEEEEEKVKAQRKDKRKERKRRFEPIDDEEQPGDEVSALMGFSRFGGGRKNC